MNTLSSPDSPGRISVSNIHRRDAVCLWTARVLLAAAVVSLLSAWIANQRGGMLLGMSEQHDFSSAIVFALLGIACLLHGLVQRRTD